MQEEKLSFQYYLKLVFLACGLSELEKSILFRKIAEIEKYREKKKKKKKKDWEKTSNVCN